MKAILKNLKYIEYATLAALAILLAKTSSSSASTFFMLSALALSACYAMIAEAAPSLGNESKKGIIAKKLGLLGMAVVLMGILFKSRLYPGASAMLMIGTYTMGFVLLLLGLQKEDGRDSQYTNEGSDEDEALTFSKKQLMPRVMIALAVGVLVWKGPLKVSPYMANISFAEDMASPYFLDKPLSDSDARIVAAWHDISHGISKEKALAAYQISEDIYDSNAEALAYGGKENIPQFRNIEISDNYQSASCADECVSPADTAYLHSLRPIYYYMLGDLCAAMDFENLANHTSNEDFKKFVRKEYKGELEALSEQAFITYPSRRGLSEN